MGESIGQTIGYIAGAVIGYYTGIGFLAGAALGGTIGKWIDPPDAPPPPALGDLSVNSYVRNAPLPLAYGQNKVCGGVVWMGDSIADTSTGGSKKNPTFTVNHTIEYAVGHCEGPVIEFLDIFIDDKSVNLKDIDEDLGFEFTNYLGTSDQVPDPNILDYQGDSSEGIPACSLKYTAYTYALLNRSGGLFSMIPSTSAEIKALLTLDEEEDANPIRVLYDYLTNKRYGMGLDTTLIDGDPDTDGSSWKIATDYCDEQVTYTDQDGNTFYEARFRYSNVFDSRTKNVDLISDILITCGGILRFVQGKLNIILENPNEEAIHYFSDRNDVDFVINNTSTVNRIYADFSDYNDDYWNDSHGYITLGGTINEIAIFDQTSTYIDLCDDLPSIPNNGTSFNLIKDNIKQGSFNYSEISSTDTYNIFRIEFINRKEMQNDVFINTYQWDVIEYEYPDVYITGLDPVHDLRPENEQKTKTIRLAGVKRKSQAMRLGQTFALYNYFNKFSCEFITDIVGTSIAMGDLVGISHSLTNWQNKLFRVISAEELENDEIKLSLVEYNTKIYNDEINKVFPTYSNKVDSPWIAPSNVDRVHFYTEVQCQPYLTPPVLYLFWRPPQDDQYFFGIQLFIQKESESNAWEYLKFHTTSNPSAVLTDDWETQFTSSEVIRYNLSGGKYGTFNDSGIISIGNFYAHYYNRRDVNTTEGEFYDLDLENCGGSGGVIDFSNTFVSQVNSGLPFTVTLNIEDIGKAVRFKFVSVSIYSILGNFENSSVTDWFTVLI